MTTFEEKLAALQKPSVEFPQHRAQLRRALLNSERSGSYPSLIMSFYKLIPSALVLVLVFGLAFALRPQATEQFVTPQASAQEIISDAVAALRGLSDEEVQALDEKLQVSDVGDLLTEARGASDLRVADDVQFSVESSEDGDAFTFTKSEDGSGLVLGVMESSTNGDFKNLSFLTFTRTDGLNVVMGMDVDQSYLPQVIMISSSDHSQDEMILNAPAQ